MYDFCVIGGGAAGMTAAIKAKQLNKDLDVVLLEKNDKLGKKLLATGNGRCNLSNVKCSNYRKVLEFFESVGVLTKTDSQGRIYPYAEEASQLVEALKLQIKDLGIKVFCDAKISSIKRTGGFSVDYTQGGKSQTITAKRLLIATGGKAAPKFGTTGDGYKWAKELGHEVTRLAPVLTPIECEGDFAKFKGIRQDALVKLYKDGGLVAEESGNLQMTEYGLSGICIFNLSRRIKVLEGENLDDVLAEHQIGVDFLPDVSEDSLKDVLLSRTKIKNIDATSFLRTLVKEEIAKDILQRIGIEQNALAVTLEQGQLDMIVKELKDWKVQVKKIKGWQHAQATSGGVSLALLDQITKESKVIKGLYFAGEILDYDGPCGGFNLQNAWITGLAVGEAIGK